MAAGVDVHTACEDCVDLGEAETSVQRGAFEGRAVSGEGDALGDVSAASELDFGSDAISLQVVAQTRQIAEGGVMFMDEVLHDLGIDGCLPDIFGQCAVSRRPRPVTDDVILQGAVSYGHGPALLMHPTRFWATAFVLSLHFSFDFDLT